ncbi:MAG: DMT family transporter [Anaerolineaceae bacterium]|nr:DMT family transporter [Anaerolineaceae bacterium]
MLANIPYSGEIAALTAALFWSIASLMFEKAGDRIRASELTLIKGVLGILMMLLTAWVTGMNFSAVATTAVLYLVISGILGIGIGDPTYFESILAMGTRKALLLHMLALPMTAVLALIFLEEQLSLKAWIGILITMAGIVWVITEQSSENHIIKDGFRKGLIFGVISAIGEAIGAVLTRAAFLQSDILPLQSGMIRLGSGTLFLLVYMLIRKEPITGWIKQKGFGKLFLLVTAATFLGTFLGIWLQQTAFERTPAGIAQTLISTSPLFVLPFAALLGEKISLRAITGVLISLLGIAMLFEII